MTGGKDAPNGSLRRLRIATGVVLAALITIMVIADVAAGSLGIREDYRTEPLVLGTIIGALLLIIGIEVGSRFPGLGEEVGMMDEAGVWIGDLRAIWPSLVITAIMIVVWIDYALFCLRVLRRDPSHSNLRKYVISVTVLLCVIGLGIAIVLVWVPPPPEPDPTVLGLTSALRVILLSVGIWLAWDRRKHRA